MAFKAWDKGQIALPDGQNAQAISPIILSASRATDIPAFFSEWFVNRLLAGYVRWKNPFNASQVQYISFSNARVIVFWTKNPKPLMEYLPQIDDKKINYYFQFTLNNYEKEGLEKNVPPLLERISTFKKISEKTGKQRVIWRFDPLILSNSLTIDELLGRISNIANELVGFTNKLVFSFADISNYKKVQNNLKRERFLYQDFTPEKMLEFSQKLVTLNKDWGFEIATCAEGIDLQKLNIEHNRCIDDNLMIELFNSDLKLMNFLGYQPSLFAEPNNLYIKDKGQRQECGCIVSKDIGAYSTCNHLCTYCYANTSQAAVFNNLKKHNPRADSLIS